MNEFAQLADRALAVLRGNDTGLFVKPAPTVYPFQWNWDSAVIAIGLAQVDVGEDVSRARRTRRSRLDH